MTENEYASAKTQYEEFREKAEKDRQIFFWQFADWYLKLPIPISYEVWCELHKYVEERVK